MAGRKDPGGASDAELARSALSGNRGAFGELVERHARQVVALAYAMIGDREKARDLAQESFLAAFQSLGSLREPGRFGAWLAGIARRQCIYAIRRERRAARALEVRRDAPVVVLPDPEGSAARSDEEARLLAALGRLGRRYREVLVLRHLEGRSYGDIAEALGLSAAAVEKRLTRARVMLRKVLEVGKS
ncbi:MAG TPA: sigma-70 family RNA polymerase sigma factor [Planctomycetota bacterium]|nr:sigma-70 family RNA polymerase sigma factor [Planctomycetota bacterium]